MGRFKVLNAFVALMIVALLSADAHAWVNAAPSSRMKEKMPYRPQWVTVLKKGGGLFKYKRKEFSSPRISGENLFVGSDNGYFYSMTKKTGHKNWRFKASGPINSAASFGRAAGSDAVFFGNDDGILYALDLQTGKLLWQTEVGSEILAPPAVASDHVIVSTMAGIIVAVSADDGHVLWKKDFQTPFTGTIKMTVNGHSPPVLDESSGRIFVGFSDGFLRAMDYRSGAVSWEKKLGKGGRFFDDVDAAPVIDKDRIYAAGFEDGVFALSKQNGSILWNKPMGSATKPVLVGDALYVAGTDGQVYALSKQDGGEIWVKKVGDGGALTSPVVYQNLLATGVSDEAMSFLDLQDGHIIARRFARKGVFSDPVLDGDRIYYLSNGGRLYSLKLVP